MHFGAFQENGFKRNNLDAGNVGASYVVNLKNRHLGNRKNIGASSGGLW